MDNSKQDLLTQLISQYNKENPANGERVSPNFLSISTSTTKFTNEKEERQVYVN